MGIPYFDPNAVTRGPRRIAILLALLLAGCSSLDEAHRGILLRRVSTLGQLAASYDPASSRAVLSETAMLVSDLDAHLK